LKETMTVFAVMSGSFVQWAFSNMKNGKPPEP
jgi:hypothetical protein